MNLGGMAMKEYSAFPKAPALQEPHNQIVKRHIQNTLYREAVGVFYSPIQLGKPHNDTVSSFKQILEAALFKILSCTAT